jgi:hypothetical protein
VAADDAGLDDELDDALDNELNDELDTELPATTLGSSLISAFTVFRGLSHQSWSRMVSLDQRILYRFLPFLGFRVTSMFHSQSESRWSWPRVLQPSQVVGFLRGVGPNSDLFLKQVRQSALFLGISPGSLHPKHRRGPSEVVPYDAETARQVVQTS